jgi:hypothetical protein
MAQVVCLRRKTGRVELARAKSVSAARHSMNPQPLDYAPAKPRRFSRRWVGAGVVVAILIAFQLMQDNFVRQEFGWIDTVSGSKKSQTITRLGATLPPVIAVSPLETKFHDLGLVWQPDWRNVRSSAIPLFGRSHSLGHGRAPAILTLAGLPDIQRYFIDHSSDDEIREFFRVMTSGTEAEQDAAIDVLCNKYFDSAK